MSRRNKKRAWDQPPVELHIDAMDDQARGVARREGKVVFVSGALPEEDVRAQYTRLRGRYDEARVEAVLKAHPRRVPARCPHFDICGGCVLQHLEPDAQRELKSERLAENLKRLGGVEPEQWAPPLVAQAWGYRNRARLGAKYVAPKGGVLVGFRERHGHRLADLHECHVLHAAVGERLQLLRDALTGMHTRDRIAQIEVAIGDPDEQGRVSGVLCVRHLDPLPAPDVQALRALSTELGLDIYLQAAGPDSVTPLPGSTPASLGYTLPSHDVCIQFEPGDFTQVNPAINRLMVAQALEWLAPAELDGVLDLFCGIGNFTLPIARSQARVAGVEGAEAAVVRARLNASLNGLEHCRFEAADLNDPDVCREWLAQGFEGLLLDPPRSGAAAVVASVAAYKPRRIVYVSCSPASLARDLDVLVNQHGYRLRRAGIIDMFPHTNHVESMALLESG